MTQLHTVDRFTIPTNGYEAITFLGYCTLLGSYSTAKSCDRSNHLVRIRNRKYDRIQFLELSNVMRGNVSQLSPTITTTIRCSN